MEIYTMFVSDVQVLRRFTKKLASVEMKDPAAMSAAERDVHNKNMLKQQPADLTDKVNMGARAAGSAVSGAANKGLEGITGAAKSLYNNATPANLGLAAAGAGLGGGALYGLSRLLQSDEEKKKKTPIMAPALGAVGGAALLPIIAALMSRGGQKPLNMDGFNTANGAASYSDAVAHASSTPPMSNASSYPAK